MLVTIYTPDRYCNACDRTKKLFANPGKDLPAVPFTPVTVDEAQTAELIAEGFLEFPIVKLSDGRSWSGFRLTEIKDLAKELAA